MKQLLSIITAIVLLLSIGCKKKDDTPGYYFKFKADGVAYHYKYICDKGIFAGGCNMGALQSTSSTFNPMMIYGESGEYPRGEVRFFLNKEDFDTKDTIHLDGERNSVDVTKMPNGEYTAGYVMDMPLTGMLIVSKKTDEYIKGTFEFEAFKIVMNEETGSSERTDTIISFTEGEFFVGRAY